MHNASTKQRISALRRRLGIFTGWQPRWVRERKERRDRLERLAAIDRAGLAASEAATAVASPPAVEPELAPAPTLRAEPPAAPESPTELATSAPGPVGAETAPAGPWCVSRPVAPSRASRGRAGGLALAAALAAIAIGLFALARRAPVPTAAAAADPAGLERPAGRDARVAVPATAVEAPPDTVGAASAIEVRRGDSLWRIAAAHLGDPMRWPELHAANAGQVQDPNLIFPGQRLQIPGAVRL